MESNNDKKVWIGNVDASINSIDELDPRTFQTTMKLIRLGAKLEIGKGPRPEYGNGIYCTNLTYPEIQELINKEEVLTKDDELIVDVLFNDLCEASRNSDKDKYENVIMPRVYRLSPPAKKLLRERINSFMRANDTISNDLVKTLDDMKEPENVVFGK